MNSSIGKSTATLPFPYSLASGPGGIENDVDPADLVHDTDVLIHAGVVERVGHRGPGLTTAFDDLLGDSLQAGPGPTSQEDQRAFRGKLLGDCGANGTSGTKTTAVLSCKTRVFMGLCIFAEALTWLIHAFGLRWIKTVEGNGGGHLSMMSGLRRQRPGSVF